MQLSVNRVVFSAPLRRVGLRIEEINHARQGDEVEAIRQDAYQRGFSDASDFLNQQMAEQRTEVIQLMEQTFRSLEEQRSELLRQVAAALPGIAVEIARRVLCGLEPDAARVQRTVEEVLGELAPGTRDLEITMHPSDLALLGRYNETFADQYPGLRFVADDSLLVGDCRLRSNFGLVDATIATKLATIARSLQ
jgi:flagellar assembly protein FliH